MDRDSVREEQFSRATGQFSLWATIGEPAHSDLPPADRSGAWEHLQRLEDRFLGREPSCKGRGGITEGVDVLPLEVSQGAVQNPAAMARKEGPSPGQLHHIEADGDYGHGNRQKASRTPANQSGERS